MAEKKKAETVSIKDYFDSRCSALEKSIDDRFQGLEAALAVRFELNDKALENAAASTEHRLNALNELRTQVLEDRQQFARKDEVELQLTPIREKLDTACGRTQGKEWSIGLIVAIVLGAAALLVNVI